MSLSGAPLQNGPWSARAAGLIKMGRSAILRLTSVAFQSAVEQNPDREQNADQADPFNADLSENFPCGWQIQ